MTARIIAIASGLWLMASPAVLGYAGTAAEVSDRIVGPVAAALSLIAAWAVARPLRWTTVPLGLWAMLAPWFLGHPTAGAVGNLVAGIALVVTAFVRGRVNERFGGGWMSLRRQWPGIPT